MVVGEHLGVADPVVEPVAGDPLPGHATLRQPGDPRVDVHGTVARDRHQVAPVVAGHDVGGRGERHVVEHRPEGGELGAGEAERRVVDEVGDVEPLRHEHAVDL